MKPNLALATRPEDGMSLQGAWSAVISGEITAERLALMRDLMKMNAEQQFAMAFTALQHDLPVIIASTVIPNRGKYERFEDLMARLGPLLTQNGFSVSFNNENKDGRVTETCHLSHIGGHTRSNQFTVRVGGRADSEAQADCKAASIAKRNAFCNSLNVVIRQDCLTSDNDAAIEGEPIQPHLAFALEARCEVTGSDKARLLKFAGATSFDTIPASKYQMIDELLKKKESR